MDNVKQAYAGSVAFDSNKAPFNSINGNAARRQKWFQATSRVYAQQTSGIAFIVCTSAPSPPF